MPTSAGQRNTRIRFERRKDASDGMGNTIGSWSLLCGPMWARLTPLRGSETILQQRLAGVQPCQLTVLSNAATRQITSADRAVNERTGEVYNIVDRGNPDERNIEISMLVKAGEADG